MKSHQIFSFIGLGIFAYLSLISLEFFVKFFLVDVFIYTKLPPIVIYGLIHSIGIGITISLWCKFLQKLEDGSLIKKHSTKKLFLYAVIAYGIAHLLGILITPLSGLIASNKHNIAHFNLKTDYLMGLSDIRMWKEIISMGLHLTEILLLVLILLNKIKKGLKPLANNLA